VSFDYYARLERGNLSGVSESVLDALAQALQLDEAEGQHLNDLARAANSTGPRRSRRPKSGPVVRPEVLSILAGMTGTPAYVRNSRFDILAANDLCRALYGGILDTLPVNMADSSSSIPALRHSFSTGTRSPTTSSARCASSRPGPARPGAQRLDRRARHLQREVRHPMGTAPRPDPPNRPQTSPQPGGR
jgi:hypothetical protein